MIPEEKKKPPSRRPRAKAPTGLRRRLEKMKEEMQKEAAYSAQLTEDEHLCESDHTHRQRTTKLSEDLMSGFKWSSFSMVLRAILQIGVLAALARLLTPHQFGVVGMATIFTSFFERVGFLGVGPAVVQKDKLTDSYVRIAYTLSIALGFVLCLALILFAPLIASLFHEPKLTAIVRALSVTFLMECFSMVSESMLQRQLRFRTLMVSVNLSYFVGQGIVGITLALLGFGVWALVLAAIAQRLIKVCFLLYIVPIRPTLNFNRQEAKELLHMGAGFSLGRLLNIFALYGDNFVVGRWMGAAALGMYGRSYQLMTIPATYFGQILEKVLFPVMAKRQKSVAHVRDMFFYCIECAALIGLPASVFIYLLSPEIILFLFGKKWAAAIPALQLLAIATFPRLCYKNADTLLRSLGAVYQHVMVQGVYAVLVVGGALIGSRWGLPGVAAAISLACILNYLQLSQLGITLLSSSWRTFFRMHASPAWCTFCIWLVLYPTVGLLHAFHARPLPVLITAAIASALTFAAALRWSPGWARPLALAPISQRLAARQPSMTAKALRWFLPEAAS